jgi:hypothetical protein
MHAIAWQSGYEHMASVLTIGLAYAGQRRRSPMCDRSQLELADSRFRHAVTVIKCVRDRSHVQVRSCLAPPPSGLDRGMHVSAEGVKIATDQLLSAPVFTCMLYAYLHLAHGESVDSILPIISLCDTAV